MRDLRLGARAELVAGLAVLVAALGEQFARSDAEHSLRAGAWIVAAWAPVLVRRAHPVAATCVAAAVIVAAPHTGGDFPPAVIQVLLPVVLAYSCGAHASPRAGLAATAALVAAIQVHVGFADFPNAEIAITTVPLWWAGTEVRKRRRLVEQLAARSRELETEEDAYVELSVRRERARIARDLHDIVSHHLAVMVIQAAAGRLAEAHDATVAATRFESIRDAGEQALAETDRLVAMLQPDANAAPRLAPLLSRARRMGVRVVVIPADPALPAEIETIAYRILQEALTNAMKHAPGAAVDIRVEHGGAELAIAVDNDRAEPSSIAHTGSGLGLESMRERLVALGGTLEARPSAAGGFRVHARIPLLASTGTANDRPDGPGAGARGPVTATRA